MEKKHKDLLDRIAKALRRRASFARPLATTERSGGGNSLKVVRGKMGRHHRPSKMAVNRPLGNSIFLSGSIGDVLALESFFSDDDRAKTTKIFYATRKQAQIE